MLLWIEVSDNMTLKAGDARRNQEIEVSRDSAQFRLRNFSLTAGQVQLWFGTGFN